MLVIGRKEGQSFAIGDNVKITVLGVKGGQVRIGIDAPKDVHIQRDDMIKKTKK